MRVLLTGGTGFLGRLLLRCLTARGDTVVLLIRRQTDLRPVAALPAGADVRPILADGLDGAFTGEERVDVVIHAATDYGHDAGPLLQPYRANVDLPMQILELAIGRGIPLFVNIDTFFSALDEGYDYMRAYRLSKRHFREWGEYAADRAGIGFANLRVFHMYGPDDGARKFVTEVTRRCLAGQPVDLTSGEQKRDFIHVDDVAAAVVLVASATLGPGYRHFDVGSGTSMRIRDFVERINQLCGKRATLNFGALPTRRGEPPDARADPSSLLSLGWRPAVDVDAGIESVIDAIGRQP